MDESSKAMRAVTCEMLDRSHDHRNLKYIYTKIVHENDERETWSIVVDTLEKLKDLYKDFEDLSDELQNICFDNDTIEEIMYDVTNTKFALKEKEDWNTNGEHKEYLKYAHYLK